MSNPIRILCVMSTLGRGGAENMCMNLYRRMDRNKVQFDFVKHPFSDNQNEFEKEIIDLGGRIYSAPRYRVFNHLSYCYWWKRFLIEHPEYQIIHGHFFTIASIYLKIAKKLKRRTIAHIHASGVNSWLKQMLVARLEEESDYAFACSKQAGQWVFPHKQFKVFNNAIDTKKFTFNPLIREQYRKDLGISNDLVLGTVGNYSHVKNPFGLLEIFQFVQKKHSNAKLIWAGDGSLRMQILDYLKQYGLENDVKLLGLRDDVPNLLQAMDAFLLPSFNEGLPVSAIEAQAAGLKCFLSDAITTEVDLTGRCSFLPLDSPEKWSECILTTNLTHIDTSQAIHSSGYDIEKNSAWLQNFYLSLAEDSDIAKDNR